MSRGTLDSARCLLISLTGLSPSLVGFPKTILLSFSSLVAVLTPECTHPGLGSFPFARHYLGNRFFFLFLRLLRCFSSPGCSHYNYLIHYMILALYHQWVPPFGYLRLIAYLQLPEAFRSLSRPSSASSAKASTICPY